MSPEKNFRPCSQFSAILAIFDYSTFFFISHFWPRQHSIKFHSLLSPNLLYCFYLIFSQKVEIFRWGMVTAHIWFQLQDTWVIQRYYSFNLLETPSHSFTTISLPVSVDIGHLKLPVTLPNPKVRFFCNFKTDITLEKLITISSKGAIFFHLAIAWIQSDNNDFAPCST